MQTTITVVNLIHDPKTDTDTPVCWVFPACSWRERIGSTGSGTAKDPAREVHIRIPAGVCSAGYLPYVQWAALLEKTHLCCTASAVSDNREPLLPHWHIEGS